MTDDREGRAAQRPITHADRVVFPRRRRDEARPRASLRRGRAGDGPARPRPPDRACRASRRASTARASSSRTRPKHFPDWIATATVPKREGGTLRQVLANDAATLVYLAGQNAITPHIWTARADRLEQPDRIVFDLDPADPALRRGPRRGARAGRPAARPRVRAVRDDDRLARPARRRRAPPRRRLRGGATRSRARSRAGSPQTSPAQLTHRVPHRQARRAHLRRRPPQRLRAARGRALRRARPAEGAGRDAAALGGAERPQRCARRAGRSRRSRTGSPTAATPGAGSRARLSSTSRSVPSSGSKTNPRT